jgi:arabinogalactan endo-1,4-beta-galactosidase
MKLPMACFGKRRNVYLRLAFISTISNQFSYYNRPTANTSNWANIARILHSASSGVKDASTTQPLIVVHTDNGWNQATQTWFYSNLMAQGTFLSTDFDIMGFSFYPFYGTSATLANLKATLNYMISTYGKDVIIAETDFPNSCSGVTLSESSIPISAAGQTTWVDDIISLLEGLPNGHGKGMLIMLLLFQINAK